MRRGLPKAKIPGLYSIGPWPIIGGRWVLTRDGATAITAKCQHMSVGQLVEDFAELKKRGALVLLGERSPKIQTIWSRVQEG